MIKSIRTIGNAAEVLNEAHRKKYAKGADVANIEFPKPVIEDIYEPSADTVNPIAPLCSSASTRAVRRDDRRFDRYA